MTREQKIGAGLVAIIVVIAGLALIRSEIVAQDKVVLLAAAAALAYLAAILVKPDKRRFWIGVGLIVVVAVLAGVLVFQIDMRPGHKIVLLLAVAALAHLTARLVLTVQQLGLLPASWLGPSAVGFLAVSLTVGGTLWYTGFVRPETPGPSRWLRAKLDAALSEADTARRRELQTDPEFRDSLRLYAQRLTWETSKGAADSNQLDTEGTTGKVSPEATNFLVNEGDLGSGEGRVQFKVEIFGRREYKVFQPGISYVWIDNLTMTGDTTGTARAVIIPDATSDTLRTRPVMYGRLGLYWNGSLARWNDWGNCTYMGCCEQ
ncbi:MAG: hypothetical protein ACRET3_10480 [Burkholderiales bacterium]